MHRARHTRCCSPVVRSSTEGVRADAAPWMHRHCWQGAARNRQGSWQRLAANSSAACAPRASAQQVV